MNSRIRYIPDEILAVFITAVIGFSTVVIIINVSRIIAWIRLLPFTD
jgi:lipopolysaccharide export LptBFGC system permease protein LptF